MSDITPLNDAERLHALRLMDGIMEGISRQMVIAPGIPPMRLMGMLSCLFKCLLNDGAKPCGDLHRGSYEELKVIGEGLREAMEKNITTPMALNGKLSFPSGHLKELKEFEQVLAEVSAAEANKQRAPVTYEMPSTGRTGH